MSKPLVTIDLEEYNNLISKKTFSEKIMELVQVCKDIDDLNEKLYCLTHLLEMGGDNKIRITVKAEQIKK